MVDEQNWLSEEIEEAMLMITSYLDLSKKRSRGEKDVKVTGCLLDVHRRGRSWLKWKMQHRSDILREEKEGRRDKGRQNMKENNLH